MQNTGKRNNRLVTQRLRLRNWQDEDLAPFAQLNADPGVREHFPSTLSPAESYQAVQDYQQRIEATGWGLWSAELISTGEFIGFIGLQPLAEEMPRAPGVEIAWRLATRFWGNGNATEGAQEVLRFAFKVLLLDEVVAITTTTNLKSQKVMERIGLVDTGENFFHPLISRKHPLAEHVLYSLCRDGWASEKR